MSDWDNYSALMDEEVDARLADTIPYDSGAGFVDIPGYVIPFGEGLGLDGLDPSLGTRWRVKVRKSLVPDPSRDHRLTHHKLGAGIWRPSGEDPEDQGRYWIFDIQKASD